MWVGTKCGPELLRVTPRAVRFTAPARLLCCCQTAAGTDRLKSEDGRLHPCRPSARLPAPPGLPPPPVRRPLASLPPLSHQPHGGGTTDTRCIGGVQCVQQLARRAAYLRPAAPGRPAREARCCQPATASAAVFQPLCGRYGAAPTVVSRPSTHASAATDRRQALAPERRADGRWSLDRAALLDGWRVRPPPAGSSSCAPCPPEHRMRPRPRLAGPALRGGGAGPCPCSCGRRRGHPRRTLPVVGVTRRVVNDLRGHGLRQHLEIGLLECLVGRRRGVQARSAGCASPTEAQWSARAPRPRDPLLF